MPPTDRGRSRTRTRGAGSTAGRPAPARAQRLQCRGSARPFPWSGPSVSTVALLGAPPGCHGRRDEAQTRDTSLDAVADSETVSAAAPTESALTVRLDSQPPRRLAIGGGTALFLYGICFQRDLGIREPSF